MKIHVKHMVSLRCKMMVQKELDKLDIPYKTIELGTIELPHAPTPGQMKNLELMLRCSGLELMDDPKAILIEKIKCAIVEMVHNAAELPKVNFSDHLSSKLGYGYTYISNIFSEVTGSTIQQFIIHHKIERVKELILYGEHNLTQISYLLHYSSVAHLSNQFKKVTGMSPSHFRKLKKQRTNNLEDV